VLQIIAPALLGSSYRPIVTRFGVSTDVSMRMLLAKYGPEAAQDVPFIQIGGMPELTAALTKRTVFAAPMSQPMDYLAQKAGMRMIANFAKEEIPFMHISRNSVMEVFEL
jgi:ABC-type nitrate/sulfonate/bicarbonate transport system substrate-binding protein